MGQGEPGQAIHMEKPLETAWVGLKVEWLRGSPGWSKQWSQVDGVSEKVPSCGLWWGMTQKRNSGFCQCFCLRDSCSPALALMPDHSFAPGISLMLFSLLPRHWSSQGVSLCMGPLRWGSRFFSWLCYFYLQIKFSAFATEIAMKIYFNIFYTFLKIMIEQMREPRYFEEYNLLWS